MVECYGCIVGYLDGIYKGNWVMICYEFVAGLNVCLERIIELIVVLIADLVICDDLVVL